MIESRQVTVAGVNAPVTVFKVINTQGYYTELCNYGASVLSIIVPDRQGKADDVLLGYPELSDHIQDGPYLGKTLGRFAGRIAKGKFTLNGQSYQLDINNGPNHLHGGPKDFLSACGNTGNAVKTVSVLRPPPSTWKTAIPAIALSASNTPGQKTIH